MQKYWLEKKEWEHIQGIIPIVCVDILPIQFAERGKKVKTFGLILRETPHQGQKWCTIGGRLLYGESLAEAIARQLHETLGNDITFKVSDDQQPVYVAQYASGTQIRHGFDAIDPRQHAIGLTYCVEVNGNMYPQGEAFDFKWFQHDNLPSSEHFGFHQDRIVNAVRLKVV